MTLVADVFFVNEITFLIALSCKIKFVTVKHIRTRTSTQLSNSLAKVCRLYVRTSYSVTVILLDMEFEPVDAIMPETVTCNFTAAREHVGEIERKIRVIKERGRSTITTFPFKKCPCRALIELVYFVVLWRNAIPALETGISAIYSPREIITGMIMDYKRRLSLILASMLKFTMSLLPRTE